MWNNKNLNLKSEICDMLEVLYFWLWVLFRGLSRVPFFSPRHFFRCRVSIYGWKSCEWHHWLWYLIKLNSLVDCGCYTPPTALVFILKIKMWKITKTFQLRKALEKILSWGKNIPTRALRHSARVAAPLGT